MEYAVAREPAGSQHFTIYIAWTPP